MMKYSDLIKQAVFGPGYVRDAMAGKPLPEPKSPGPRPVAFDSLMPGELTKQKTNFTNPPQPKPVNTPDPIKPQPAGEGQKDITPPAVTEPPQEQQTGNTTFSSFLQSLWNK